MAKKSTPATPVSRILDRNALKFAITIIGRRSDDLKAFDVNSINDQFDAKASALLDRINDSIAEIFGHGTIEYNNYSLMSLSGGPISMTTDFGHAHSIGQIRSEYKNGIDDAIIHLDSLKDFLEERLQDMSPTPGVVVANTHHTVTMPALPDGRKVFIVHGHDEPTKQSVARYLKQLDFEPVILHEQANKGRTIIEKLESHIKDVAYVIVLLTPDDIAAPADEPSKKHPRARQNVILELGLFIGALGRERVCALYKSGVDIPSDYNGVVWISLDGDHWKFAVAKELKAVGLDVDLNKLN